MADTATTCSTEMSPRLVRRDVLVVLTVFPVLYLLHGFFPDSQRLFVDNDHHAWGAFWAVIAVLHWTSVAAVVVTIRRRGVTLADLGLRATPPKLFAVTAALVAYGLVITFVRVQLGPVPFLHNPVFGVAAPWTTSEALRWIPMAITAGYCEELVYRGFGINGQIIGGATRTRAITTATIAFVFLHGFSAFVLFPVYIAVAMLGKAILRRTGNLLPAMVIHSLIDLTVIIASGPHH